MSTAAKVLLDEQGRLSAMIEETRLDLRQNENEGRNLSARLAALTRDLEDITRSLDVLGQR